MQKINHSAHQEWFGGALHYQLLLTTLFVTFFPVIRAKVKEVKTKCHDVTVVVEVKEILKSSLVNIPKDTVNLHTNSGCLCPPLSANEEYIIMGYEDEERSR